MACVRNVVIIINLTIIIVIFNVIWFCKFLKLLPLLFYTCGMEYASDCLIMTEY